MRVICELRELTRETRDSSGTQRPSTVPTIAASSHARRSACAPAEVSVKEEPWRLAFGSSAGVLPTILVTAGSEETGLKFGKNALSIALWLPYWCVCVSD